ncbi:MAG: type II secretion system F family protein [Candidatus Omnitrophica bacterium]|nr:type II secretion system F family protein [Candidatus Omnitrophota bacterium]
MKKELFNYTAVDREGKDLGGQVEAVNLNAALSKIRQMGIFPSHVIAADEQVKSRNIFTALIGKLNFIKQGESKFKPEDKVVFTRQLAVLLNAGLPLLRGLQTINKQTRFGRMKVIIDDIIDMIQSGKTFSGALAHYPDSFSRIYINVVKSGETGGALDEVLKRLADYLERNLRLTQRIKAALIYPCLVLVVSIIILGFIVAFVIPRFMELFQNTGVALPLLTRTLLAFSNLLLERWYLLFGGIALIFISYKLLLRNYTVRYFNDKIMLNLPVFGLLIQKITASRFARTLATLLEGGVPILRALELTKQVSGNEVIAKAINSVYESVREGGFISKVLENTNVFPQLMVNMIAVGEESGSLDKILIKVADTFDEEIEITAGSLTSLLEPLLIIVMGVVVGIIVLSMFLPLITLINSLSV